ncbi:MAG: hypothetical protein HY925_10160 [Elusimicrobia bacterium]|nr:hypothetical protein [Elusimicrobiota bacterium]
MDHNGPGRRGRFSGIRERIRRRTSVRVARAAAGGPEALRRRLARLSWEPDIHRACGTSLAAAALLGAGLAGRRKSWLLLTGAAAGLWAHQVATGTGPACRLLRRLGFRTTREILQERETLLAGLGAD